MIFVGKPSEKVGRKAMGLQIVNLDRQAAPVYLVCLAFFYGKTTGGVVILKLPLVPIGWQSIRKIGGLR